MVVYVRFEEFLEAAGWDMWADPGAAVPIPPNDNFNWQDFGVYDRFRGQIDFISNMEFDQIKDVTLVIVTPFGRFSAKHIDEPRLSLNFLEVVLPTYAYFNNKTASVKVVSIPIEKLEQLKEKIASHNAASGADAD